MRNELALVHRLKCCLMLLYLLGGVSLCLPGCTPGMPDPNSNGNDNGNTNTNTNTNDNSSVSRARTCVGCHTDQTLLMAVARDEEPPPASTGEG